MARKQTAILSVTRGVTTLNGLVVERPWGEDPHQAGIRAVRDQLAAPGRKPVEVVATDDDARVRLLVHPDGTVTDVETLEVFGASAGVAAGAAWLPGAAGAVVVDEPEVGPEVGSESETETADEGSELPPVLAVPAPPVEQPEPEPAPAPAPEPQPEPEPEPASAPVPAPTPVPEPEPEPSPPSAPPPSGPPPSGPPPSGRPPATSASAAGPLVPMHHMDPGPYRRPRVTRRGRVVLAVVGVLVLLLIFLLLRGCAGGSGEEASGRKEPAQQSSPSESAGEDVVEPPSESPSPSASTSPSKSPSESPSRSASSAPVTPQPTKKPDAAPQPSRTLSVKAIAMTEAIGLRIDASRLPVTATITMDPWGEPEPFTRTVTISEPDQLVKVRPVGSGHAEWSVKVPGAKKVSGYTHSWPKGDRKYDKR